MDHEIHGRLREKFSGRDFRGEKYPRWRILYGGSRRTPLISFEESNGGEQRERRYTETYYSEPESSSRGETCGEVRRDWKDLSRSANHCSIATFTGRN